jgi:ribosomal protein L11 methyltransferase
MNTTWAEVACEVPAALVDLLAEFLVELSGMGVSIENLALDTFSLDTLADTPVKTVKAYIPADTELAAKLEALDAFLAAHRPSLDDHGHVPPPPTVTYIQEEDWANNWKAHFPPTRVGTRLVIKPTWHDFAAGDGDIILQLDPGMAFGTGTHPTTRLCLEALEQIFFHEGPFRNLDYPPPQQLLDVGTGTGILAIAAYRMGAVRVLGIDIDTDAVAIARENLALNGLPGTIDFSATPLAEIPGDFAIVVANILAEELARLAGELALRVRSGGFLILSGVLTEKEGIVVAAFAPLLLTPVVTSREGEWSCLVYHREG